jgi:3-hydroxyacyl-CoA dehydrogenase/enoyl-CoA hydratase/3-hydroxybutyryl-CoA epimerase
MLALHFTAAAIKKSRGVADSRVEARPVRDIGVVGAGTMGSGIAYVATRAEIPVRMRDIKHEANARALNQVRELYRPQVEREEVTPAEVERRMALIAPTLELKGFRRSDLVIESVVEDLETKLALLRELEPEVREDAIIASNTSSSSITALGAALWRPSRFLGMHFFYPAGRNRLVEIVRGEQTEDEAVATAFALVKRLGKVPIVVADRPGFLVHRILMPYLNEACILVEEGLAIDVVDRAMRNFGMPLGPLELLDEIGLDVAVRAGENLRRATGITPSPLLTALVAQGRLGRKAGLGFYRTTGSVKRVDADVLGLIESLPSAAPSEGVNAPEFTANVQERLVLPMINEAARALTEGAVDRPELVDLAMVLGAGFPSFRGGILRYADSLELAILVERMHALASDGRERYQPAPLLADLVRQGRKFYPER